MSFTWGHAAKEMLVEVKRSDWLPPYNDEAVRKTIAEINILNNEIEKTLRELTETDISMQKEISDLRAVQGQSKKDMDEFRDMIGEQLKVEFVKINGNFNRAREVFDDKERRLQREVDELREQFN